MSQKIAVSIIGATGYTGIELIRVLSNHPYIDLKHITSMSHTGTKLSELYPHLQGICDISLTDTDLSQVAKESDVVFLALPHLESQKILPLLSGKTKIIDLAGDFRIQDVALFERYYGKQHSAFDAVSNFVYGFPEFQKEKIADANSVANPGCFALTAQLALLPLKGLIKNVQIFALTGSSGSGKSPKPTTHHPVRNHNVSSYRIGIHQHIPEILQTIELSEKQMVFVPTSGPFTRGIHLTAFVQTENNMSLSKAKQLFETFYQDAPFVRIKDKVELAETIGSNFCDITAHSYNGKIIVQAVLDNLMKGASGNAVQNLNLMFGLQETTGLNYLVPLYP